MHILCWEIKYTGIPRRQIKKLVKEGRFIEAVKLHRSHTGGLMKTSADYCRAIRGH